MRGNAPGESPEIPEGGTNLQRLLTDPSYDPTLFRFALGQSGEASATELQRQPLFKKQKQTHQGGAGAGQSSSSARASSAPSAVGAVDVACRDLDNVQVEAINFHDLPDSENAVCTIEVPLPMKENEWKRMERDSTSWLVKAMRKQEVAYGKLVPSERVKFDEAKETEVSQSVKDVSRELFLRK